MHYFTWASLVLLNSPQFLTDVSVYIPYSKLEIFLMDFVCSYQPFNPQLHLLSFRPPWWSAVLLFDFLELFWLLVS